MAWVAQLHAVMQHHAWAAAVQTPGGAAGQSAAHQVLLVDLRAQQAGATGGGAAVGSVPGSSVKEASSFGPAVDQGHKSAAQSTPMYVTDLDRVNLLQEQVAATLLDPRNMPDLNCIPPDQHDEACAVWSLP